MAAGLDMIMHPKCSGRTRPSHQPVAPRRPLPAYSARGIVRLLASQGRRERLGSCTALDRAGFQRQAVSRLVLDTNPRQSGPAFSSALAGGDDGGTGLAGGVAI